MELISSADKLLLGPEIITRVAQADTGLSKNVEAAMASAAGTLAEPETKGIQVRNTMFVASRGRGEDTGRYIVDVYNVEPAARFAQNLVMFFGQMQRQNMKTALIALPSKPMAQLMLRLAALLDKSGTRINVAENPKQAGQFLAFVTPGKTPLPTRPSGAKGLPN